MNKVIIEVPKFMDITIKAKDIHEAIRELLKLIADQEKGQSCNGVEEDPAFDLASLAVKTGIPDLAAEHNHYLYGTPKQGS